MAWIMDSCEIEMNNEPNESGQVNGEFYQVRDLCIREVDDMVFFGRIKDADGNGLEGALLKIFAIKSDETEVPLNHFYSGANGCYLVSVARPDYPVVKYVIRTSMSYLPGTDQGGKGRFQKIAPRTGVSLANNTLLDMNME